MIGEYTFKISRNLDILLGIEDIGFAILELNVVSSLPYFINDEGHFKGDSPLLMSCEW